MRIRLQALLSAATVLALGSAQGQTPANPWFRQLDSNHDGYLQRAEAGRVQGIARAFDEADANRDGKLDPAEFVRADAIRQNAKLPALPQDADTSERVRAELGRDPELKELNLQVRTHRGRVTLTGAVRDADQRALAVKAAAGVEGVSAVGDAMSLR